MISIMAVQQALAAAGFDPGPIDGILGRLTLKAIREFRVANQLSEDGGIDAAFAERLMADNPILPSDGDAPWYTTGWRLLHQHEQIHNRSLSRFLASDNKTLGDPARNAWCGDFVQTCLALTLPLEPMPTQPYLARAWLEFGRDITAEGPRMGAILVFWRGSRDGWKGHVGFYNGEDDKNFSVLGGNQGNRVSIARLSKDRLLGIRWPSTFAYDGPQPRSIDSGAAFSENEA